MREDAAWSPILREQGALEELAAIGVEIIRNARLGGESAGCGRKAFKRVCNGSRIDGVKRVPFFPAEL